MKKVLILLIKFLIKPLDFVMFLIFGKGHLNAIFSILCPSLETKTLYASYQVRPKDTSVIPILEGLNQSQSFAIVMQGPLCKKDNMTVNSIKFYKKAYPLGKIIVSTWKDESEEDIENISELGAIVVQSEKPSNSGYWNINYQLVSSLSGVKKAKELGCEFAVKTRTDQRICKPFIFDTMISAIKLFPSGQGQKGRLVTLGIWGGGMFIPYHTSDFLYLGYTDDLIQLFSAPLDKRKNEDNKHLLIESLSRRQNSENMLSPEIYILKHYCKDVLHLSCEDTVEEYWNVTKNYIICYGPNDVNLMWEKYDKLYSINFFSSEYFGNKDSKERLQTMCFDFFNWFNLYTGNIQYDKNYEQHADVKMLLKNE